MKTLTTIFFTLILSIGLFAQTPVNDSVSIGAGYANQTFYSLAGGTISSIDNSDWELAFHADNREVAIFVNSKKDVKLYLASTDTSKWNSLDTTNKTAKQFHNSDSSWSYGAFNREAPAGGFDYGWGTYNATSHEVYGTKIYFINYGTTWKKIMITSHDASYAYHFRYSNLDGSGLVNATIVKANYPKRNFIYYSLINNSILNREPNVDTYDLIFHQYEQEIPFSYKVTGVQQNRNVKAKKVYPVNDVNTATLGSTVLSSNITSIGSDWKSFDVNQNKYVIEDSTVYFVKDYSGTKIWKIVFTGFGGSSAGKMYFSKTAFASGITEQTVSTLGVYPNPAHDQVTLNFYSGRQNSLNLSIKDLTGRVVSTQSVTALDGFNDVQINTASLPNGTYLLVLEGANNQVQKLVISH